MYIEPTESLHGKNLSRRRRREKERASIELKGIQKADVVPCCGGYVAVENSTYGMNSDPEETKNPTTPTGSRSILHRVVNAINQYFPQERDNKGWQDPSNPLLHGWRYVARDPVLTSEQRDHARIQEALEAEGTQIVNEAFFLFLFK